MEQINQVIIRGIIGSARTQNIGDTEMVRFSVATDYVSRTSTGQVTIETTWHRVTAFYNDRMPDFYSLTGGVKVEVKGRLRNTRYVTPAGTEQTINEILASDITVIQS